MGSRATTRRIVRRLVALAAALVAVAIFFLLFVVFPIPLYPHHENIGSFSVYSDRQITRDMASAILEAESRAGAGELYPPGRRYRVFLSHSLAKYAFFCSITRRRAESQALVFTRAGSMIVSLEGVAQMRQRTGGVPRHSRLEGSLGLAVAHEVAHIQAETTLRSRGAGRLPYWLSEGWADYTAGLATARQDPSYCLADRARLAFDDTAWGPPSRPADQRHFRWHVLVEYLATVRGLNFDQLADGSFTEKDVTRALVAWLTDGSGTAPPEP